MNAESRFIRPPHIPNLISQFGKKISDANFLRLPVVKVLRFALSINYQRAKANLPSRPQQ